MRRQENFESKFLENLESPKEENQNKSEKFRKFLSEQISLPEEEWNEDFKDYLRKKYEEQATERPELSSEEERRMTFERYLRGLDLNQGDLTGKRILDLGCGEEGEFVKECLGRKLAEVYGLDLSINPKAIEKKYRKLFFKGSFEEEFPIKNLDLVISVGAVEAPSNEDELAGKDLNKTLISALRAIREGGEIRIYPVRKAPPESELSGIEFSRRKWQEILDDLSFQGLIEYEFRPIDINASGKKPDVWLEEVLILKKKAGASKEESQEEELGKARNEAESAFEEGGEKE